MAQFECAQSHLSTGDDMKESQLDGINAKEAEEGKVTCLNHAENKGLKKYTHLLGYHKNIFYVKFCKKPYEKDRTSNKRQIKTPHLGPQSADEVPCISIKDKCI